MRNNKSVRKCKEVEGIVAKNIVNMRKGTLTVRYTRDNVGETLSICSEKDGIMLAIPLEPIRGWLK